jgi:hypothetical protein
VSRGTWRAPKPRAHVWQPAPGFAERTKGIWTPEDWTPGPYQLPTPAVTTHDEALREYHACASSLPYFAFTHCYSIHTDDPTGVAPWRKVPYYPHLRRFFHAVQLPCNVVDDKSRQMFMTWAWCVVFLWDIAFHARWENLVISRRAREVDDGGAHSSANSLLGKVRHLWLSLPPYLQTPLTFVTGTVHDEESGSVIHGETGTAKAGRGSTMRRVLVDEAAYIERSEGVFKSVRQVAKTGTILQSTPNGKGNAFYRVGHARDNTFLKFHFHWSEHPEKARGLYCTCGWVSTADGLPPHVQFETHDCTNRRQAVPSPPERRSPWYDRECRDMTPEQVATDLDISYEQSVRGRVFDFFDQMRHVRDHQYLEEAAGTRLGERLEAERADAYRRRYLRAALVKNRQCVVGWDFGVADPTSLVLGQVIDEARMHVHWLDDFEANNKGWPFFYDFVFGLWDPIVKECTGLDLAHYGDPAGKGRASDLTSWVTNLRSKEPPIVLTTSPVVGTVLEWLDFIRLLQLRGAFSVSSYAAATIDSIQQYRFPTDPDTGELIPGKQLPVHDEFSHRMSALRYVYMFRWPHRLHDVEARAVNSDLILAAGMDDLREQPPKAW